MTGTREEGVYVYQFMVYLQEIEPLIWRRFLAQGNTTLDQLHLILQAVMGWENYHLHNFIVQEKRYGDPQDDEFGILVTLNEHDFQIAQVAAEPGDKILYTYDFGDNWTHILEVEEIRAPQAGEILPRCTLGERSGPPENVGGSYSYSYYLNVLKDQKHDEYDGMMNWRGPFDPENFSLDMVNRKLSLLVEGADAHPIGFSKAKEIKLINDFYIPITDLAHKLDEEQFVTADTNPTRLDMVVLLEYLRDHKVTGTQTANLPLKAAKEMSAQFFKPPAWEVQITKESVYQVRSSADIWSIDFLVVLADLGDLITRGPSRRFRLTPAGESFLKISAPLQIWFLFIVWWIKANWLYAVSWEGIGEELPVNFQNAADTSLLALPVNQNFPYELFADRLIAVTNLKWSSENETYARESLHDSIEQMIVRPLVDLGMIVPTYKTVDKGLWKIIELVSIKMTVLGSNLFHTVA